MKRLMCVVALAVGISFGLSLDAGAAGTGKIGYIDINGAAAQSQWGKKVLDQIKREQERLGGELDQKGKSFKAAKDEFDKKRDVMDEKSRTKKQKELQDMAVELEKLASESSQQFNKLAQDAKTPLFQKINEILQKIGRDDKYDYIIEKSAVPFASDQFDLTKRVVSELDKSSPK